MMLMQDFVEKFPWKSDDHKKQFLGMIQFVGNLPAELTMDGAGLLTLAAYIFEKQTGTYEHTRDMVGDQLTDLRKEIRDLQVQLREQKKATMALSAAFKLQAMAMRMMNKPVQPKAVFTSLPEKPKA